MRPRPALARKFLIAIERGCYLGAVLVLTGTLSNNLLRQANANQAIAKLPNMQMWSESRKAHYLEALESKPGQPMARLEVPTIALDVPVYASDSDLHLDLGSGVITGMDYPHENGHIGIAGHRDGYFRTLRDLSIGDELKLHTLAGLKRFVVDDLRVVDPNEVKYLAATNEQRLTIVTCYPFYFVGDAPQRYLVRATPIQSSQAI